MIVRDNQQSFHRRQLPAVIRLGCWSDRIGIRAPPQNLLFMLSSLHLKTPPFSWVAPLRFATFRTTNYASSRLFLLERSRFGWRARTPPDVMQISLAKRTFSTPFFRVEADESSHPKFRPNSPHIVGLATRRSATWPRYYERRTD